ncbi:hypothetical protein NKR19_g7474 [Coniochaeta hoffmannii]|uniref:Uncharacterized protein n=1 Tax=Coniochaeta hoffmannii TaxID=91930 RepID=A0AA38VLY8_9PEZI|nr:hypothetical protein NKR19_g7474 [Coniochaeta hoffmannii]
MASNTADSADDGDGQHDLITFGLTKAASPSSDNDDEWVDSGFPAPSASPVPSSDGFVSYRSLPSLSSNSHGTPSVGNTSSPSAVGSVISPLASKSKAKSTFILDNTKSTKPVAKKAKTASGGNNEGLHGKDKKGRQGKAGEREGNKNKQGKLGQDRPSNVPAVPKDNRDGSGIRPSTPSSLETPITEAWKKFSPTNPFAKRNREKHIAGALSVTQPHSLSSSSSPSLKPSTGGQSSTSPGHHNPRTVTFDSQLSDGDISSITFKPTMPNQPDPGTEHPPIGCTNNTSSNPTRGSNKNTTTQQTQPTPTPASTVSSKNDSSDKAIPSNPPTSTSNRPVKPARGPTSAPPGHPTTSTPVQVPAQTSIPSGKNKKKSNGKGKGVDVGDMPFDRLVDLEAEGMLKLLDGKISAAELERHRNVADEVKRRVILRDRQKLEDK